MVLNIAELWLTFLLPHYFSRAKEALLRSSMVVNTPTMRFHEQPFIKMWNVRVESPGDKNYLKFYFDKKNLWVQ